MWYDELGPMLESHVEALAEALGASTLAVWILRRDGRYFLEEPASTRFMSALLPPGSRIQGTRPASTHFPSVDELEIIDPEDPPDEVLVLESLYPAFLRPPVGFTRAVGPDSPLYPCMNAESPRTLLVDLPPDHLPPGFCESDDRRFWICRLSTEKRVLGFIGVPAREVSDDLADKFERVWKDHLWRWERLQVEAALARRTATLEAVQAVGNTITSQFEIHDILQSVVEQATVLMRAKVASLMLADLEKGELLLESVYGSSPDYIRKPNLDINKSLIGKVVRIGRPVMVHDVRTCAAYRQRDLAKNEGLVSLLSVPLKWRETTIGALNVYSARKYRYTEDDLYLLSMLASQAAIAIQNARALRQASLLEEQVHDMDKRSLVGELAAGVAHEIRNPLAVVKMLIDSWESQNETQYEDIKVISTQLNGINRCVSQLLETARPQTLEIQDLDLRQEIPNIFKFLRVRLRDQGIEAQVEIPEDGTLVRADASRLRQMLVNILLNALNAMPSGGRIRVMGYRCTLGSFGQTPGTWIIAPQSDEGDAGYGVEGFRLSVSDTGGGIPEVNIQEAFEPFKTRRPGGFGLGLSVVKRIVEEHQAYLKVENNLGEGVGFHLFLPIKGMY